MCKITLAISVATIICSGATALPSIAADYPERPVRVIVPGAPGGGPDVSTRIIAAELTRQMGRQFIVDNRSGASGTIGIEILARAAPDGYTIGHGNLPTLAIHRSILTKLSYDPDRDIQPIAQYSVSHSILVVALSLPVKSVQELLDYARKNPGKLLFASNGSGSLPHLAAEIFKRLTGAQMAHVPYKGTQQAVTDMIGGQVNLMFDSATSIGVHVKAGRVRGIAVTTAKRSPFYPELPTIAESGVPNYEVTTFAGIIAPAGVSKAIVKHINAEVNKALATSTVKEKFGVLTSAPTGGTPEEFAALIKREAIIDLFIMHDITTTWPAPSTRR